MEFEWIGLLQGLILVVVLGFGTERGTEVIKKLSRLIGAKVNWEGIKGDMSFIVSAIVAAVIVFAPDFNLLGTVNGLGFELLDPEMAKLLSTALVLFAGNKLHK